MSDEPKVVTGPLTGAQRKANERARKAGKPEPFVKVSQEELDKVKDQYDIDLAFASEQDATGEFYKSEVRLLTDLLAIYYGTDINAKEDDEETDKKKKSKKTTNQPNPSKDVLTIKAVWGPNGEPIEPKCWPNCDHTICGKHLRSTFEVNWVVSFKHWLDLRDKSRKNLMWFCRLLGKGPFHSVHQYICDQFVQKNFDGLLKPGYDLDDFHESIKAQKLYANVGTGVTQDGIVETRELLLLEQRGGYKSTLDGCDCVQWIINCPDIRIMMMTAYKPLAKKRAKEIKAYFFLAEKGKPKPFHILFPEFITRGVAGSSDGPLESPARILVDTPEPTMWFTSAESSSTGQHCDLLKGDDIVDLKNSADDEMREALKYVFDSARTDLLDPWGIVYQTGTRYFTDDMYGARFKPNPDSKRVDPFRYSCRGAWTLSPDDQIAYMAGTLTVADIIEQQRATLTFPYNRGWAKLRSMFDSKGERNFKNQQMNEATDAADLSDYVNHFTHDLLVSKLYSKDSAPQFGDTWVLWDLAYSKSSTSDFSVGVAVKLCKDKRGLWEVVVLDAVYGKWKDTELATNMALFAKKFPESRGTLTEKINGLSWLLLEVQKMAMFYGVADMKFGSFEVDNARNAKRTRIKNLGILLEDNRLHFVSSSQWNDECFKQFEMFTGDPSTSKRKDDFPDAISFVFQILPHDVVKGGNFDPAKSRKEREERAKKESLQIMYDRTHGQFYGGTIKNPGTTPQGLTARTYDQRNQPPPAPDPEPPRPTDPRAAQMQQLMKILPPGFRRQR